MNTFTGPSSALSFLVPSSSLTSQTRGYQPRQSLSSTVRSHVSLSGRRHPASRRHRSAHIASGRSRKTACGLRDESGNAISISPTATEPCARDRLAGGAERRGCHTLSALSDHSRGLHARGRVSGFGISAPDSPLRAYVAANGSPRRRGGLLTNPRGYRPFRLPSRRWGTCGREEGAEWRATARSCSGGRRRGRSRR